MNKLILIVFLLFGLPFPQAYSQELNGEQIYAKINDAIVTIYTFDANGKILSQGSGVVLNDKGWVVTNYHVFVGADKIVVKHKEKIIEYTNIVGLDVEKDILILKIKDNSFHSIKIGNSDSLKVGQKIYAIGSPLGFENSITEGIISGLRHFKKETKDFIQISASISPGSSGGAVVNTKGQLIAISTLTFTGGQNLNFAIPVNVVLAVYKQGGVSQNEVDGSVYFYKGLYEMNQENYDAAINDFLKTIALIPESAEAYNNLALAYENKEDYETSIGFYKKAIALNPELAWAYSNLGGVLSKKGDYGLAIIYCKKAISLNPNDAVSFFNLGYAYDGNEDYETAIIYYKKAIEINPDFFEAYDNLALCYIKKGDNEAAMINYQKAISINPEDYKSYGGLASIYLNKGDYDTAIKYFKKVIIIDPRNALAYYFLGVAYGSKGDNNSKLFYLEKAYQLDPSLRK